MKLLIKKNHKIKIKTFNKNIKTIWRLRMKSSWSPCCFNQSFPLNLFSYEEYENMKI